MDMTNNYLQSTEITKRQIFEIYYGNKDFDRAFIMNALDISKACIYNWVKLIKIHGYLIPPHKTGPPPLLGEVEMKFVSRSIAQLHNITTKEMASRLTAKFDISASIQTVRLAMHNAGFISKRVSIKELLAQKNEMQ